MSYRQNRIASALVGVVLGAGLMGGIASTRRGNVTFSAVEGGILVGILWHGVAVGTVSMVTLSTVLFVLFGFMIGPGCDDYEGILALPAAIIGAVVGWQFRKPRRKVGALKTTHEARDFSSGDF
jgi:hypothetical protein